MSVIGSVWEKHLNTSSTTAKRRCVYICQEVQWRLKTLSHQQSVTAATATHVTQQIPRPFFPL